MLKKPFSPINSINFFIYDWGTMCQTAAKSLWGHPHKIRDTRLINKIHTQHSSAMSLLCWVTFVADAEWSRKQVWCAAAWRGEFTGRDEDKERTVCMTVQKKYSTVHQNVYWQHAVRISRVLTLNHKLLEFFSQVKFNSKKIVNKIIMRHIPTDEIELTLQMGHSSFT